METISRQQIELYLQDALPSEFASRVENAIRENPSLLALVSQVRRESDYGEHSVGAIWRRARISCPSREQLSMFLEEVLDVGHTDYITGHLKLVGCHMCRAMLDDLIQGRNEPKAKRAERRKRILDSSAGILNEPNKRS
jgi:hypothetical protein